MHERRRCPTSTKFSRPDAQVESVIAAHPDVPPNVIWRGLESGQRGAKLVQQLLTSQGKLPGPRALTCEDRARARRVESLLRNPSRSSFCPKAPSDSTPTQPSKSSHRGERRDAMQRTPGGCNAPSVGL